MVECVCMFWTLKSKREKKVIGKKTPRYTIFQCPRKWPQIHSQNPSHMPFISVVCKILLLLLPLLLHLFPDTQLSVIFCLNVKPYPCLICVTVYMCVSVSVCMRAFFANALKFIPWAQCEGIYIVHRTKVIFAQTYMNKRHMLTP